jgi:hypothetical protein
MAFYLLNFSHPVCPSFDNHLDRLLSLLPNLFQLLFPDTLHKVSHTLVIFCIQGLYFRTYLVLGHIFGLKPRPRIVVVGIFAMVLERTCNLEGVAYTIVVEEMEEGLIFDIEVVEDTFGLEEEGIFCLGKEDTFGPGAEDTFDLGVEDICFVN